MSLNMYGIGIATNKKEKDVLLVGIFQIYVDYILLFRRTCIHYVQKVLQKKISMKMYYDKKVRGMFYRKDYT